MPGLLRGMLSIHTLIGFAVCFSAWHCYKIALSIVVTLLSKHLHTFIASLKSVALSVLSLFSLKFYLGFLSAQGFLIYLFKP